MAQRPEVRLSTFLVRRLLALSLDSAPAPLLRVLDTSMGQTITSVVDMVSFAGDLRRAAKKIAAPELA
jgi:hypothetical protein